MSWLVGAAICAVISAACFFKSGVRFGEISGADLWRAASERERE